MSKIDIKVELAGITEQGVIPINHLKRYWQKALLKRNGVSLIWQSEAKLDMALLDCLGLGLEPTMSYLFQTAPSFVEFEMWIQTQTNLSERWQNIERFNSLFYHGSNETTDSDFLSQSELAFFDTYGYAIIRNAIPCEDCNATVDLITQFLNIDLQRPDTWYQNHSSRQGIMVQFFKHEILERNRQSPRIRLAFETLWKRRDLWVTTDRVGFNPPETDSWKYPGPYLHLDIDATIPLPFGLQGILYLTDTAENQGALTVVPGFHRKIDTWMSQFGHGEVPLSEAFDEFEKKPIAANAGDLIIWHHGLPHGSSPNTHTSPRIVQYINWYPVF